MSLNTLVTSAEYACFSVSVTVLPWYELKLDRISQRIFISAERFNDGFAVE